MEAVQEKNISCCGVNCTVCEYFQQTCQGCRVSEGRPHWITYVENQEGCHIYACCKHRKKLKHCGHCHEFPCEQFEQTDPNKSVEENQKAFQEKLRNLSKMG